MFASVCIFYIEFQRFSEIPRVLISSKKVFPNFSVLVFELLCQPSN